VVFSSLVPASSLYLPEMPEPWRRDAGRLAVPQVDTVRQMLRRKESAVIFGISKTTLAGILAAIIGTAGPVTAYLATVNNPKAATASGIVTLLATVARVWVGLLQGDAPPNPPKAAA
jgi:hypothetical protein